MHPQTYSPGLTAATTAVRALIAAGWIYDSTTEMADDTTIRALLHPSGREIHARTVDGDETTSLTMTGLSLEQVAGAITGAGLAADGIVERALVALAAFGVTTEREAGQLLPMWRHFATLTADDRVAVYRHYRKGGAR